PLARYMRAFDVYVGAAGYNSCCEVLQSGVPALFVPNTLVVDDQTRRAERVAEAVPAVVSPCETASQRADAVSRLMELAGRQASSRPPLDGAERAAEEILALLWPPIAAALGPPPITGPGDGRGGRASTNRPPHSL